jgi:sulfate transport system substrate-binding protein
MLLSRKSRSLRGIIAAAMIPIAAGATPAHADGSTVNVVGYSIVKDAYTALETAFKATPEGAGVTFTNSFGASGTQANNVVAGQAADVVNLSLEPDITTIVNSGKIATDWKTQLVRYAEVNPTFAGKRQQTVYTTPGIVTDSIVVFVVRPGNPRNIKDWTDLTQSGLTIINPDPRSSGSAKWNLLAAYSAALSSGKTSAKAQDFLGQVIKNITIQPTSGSLALASFIAGNGDVLLSYEDDALAAIAKGKAIQIVTPSTSFLIENPLALTTTGESNVAAKNFYKFLYSPAGQTIWAQQGYRPVLKSVWTSNNASFPKFKTAKALYSVNQLDKKGWSAVDTAFFADTVKFGKDKKHPTEGIVTYYLTK